MQILWGRTDWVVLCDQHAAETWSLLAEAGATLPEACALMSALERTAN